MEKVERGRAYLYLRKQNKLDTDYKEAWGSPRLPKEVKIEVKKQIVTPKFKKDKELKR